ncbi:MAG: fibronectin type III domain-containing protein, partial [Muribaculaceae bacterium]
ALSGKIDWIVSLDDKDLDLGEANPGETVTLSFSSGTVGMHTISAFARNSSGKGPQASERKWIGVDTPLPLENCKLTVSGDQATISWDAPVKGAHDGYFDPAAVNYRVIRQPGNVTVCQKTTQTSYTDKLDLSRLASYFITTS